MTPPAKAAAKTTAKTTAKKVTKKKAPRKKKAPKKELTGVALAKKAILDQTGQKPITASFSTHPHAPSGNVLIDDIIGGTITQDGKGAVCPGYPRKRIVEIYGPEGSGKTTLGLQCIAEVQKQGGNCIFLDFEHAIHHGYAKAIGVNFNTNKLLLYAPNTLEEGFKDIYLGILSGVDVIVVDSVAAMVPKKELDRDIDEEDIVGLQARRMSTLLKRVANWLNRKEALKRNPKGTAIIFINQTRADIKNKSGEDTTPGGKALKFYASLRLKVRRTRSETLERKDPLTGKKKKFPFGNHTEVKIIKNKMDLRQGYTTDIFIRFGYGIDEFYSVIEAGVNAKVIQKKSGWFHYNGDKWQGREKFRSFLKDNPQAFGDIRDGVLASVAADIEEMMPDDDELDEIDELKISASAEFGDIDDDDDDDDDEPEDVIVTDGDDDDGFETDEGIEASEDDGSEDAETDGD